MRPCSTIAASIAFCWLAVHGFAQPIASQRDRRHHLGRVDEMRAVPVGKSAAASSSARSRCRCRARRRGTTPSRMCERARPMPATSKHDLATGFELASTSGRFVKGVRSLQDFLGDRLGPWVRGSEAPDPVDAAAAEIHHAGFIASIFGRLQPCSITQPKSNRMRRHTPVTCFRHSPLRSDRTLRVHVSTIHALGSHLTQGQLAYSSVPARRWKFLCGAARPDCRPMAWSYVNGKISAGKDGFRRCLDINLGHIERLSDGHYKPIICNPGTMLKDGRCVKVAKAKAPTGTHAEVQLRLLIDRLAFRQCPEARVESGNLRVQYRSKP